MATEQKWAYRQFTASLVTSFGESRYVVRLSDGSAEPAIDVLGDWGDDGWELVTAAATHAEHVLYTFKRPMIG